MSAARPDRVVIDPEHGTPEHRWVESGLLDNLELFALADVGRALVVAPHPDDEVLAMGGTMRLLSELGCRVELVAVTDGEASHPGSSELSKDELRSRRPAESAEACARLGVVPSNVHRFEIPDGAVAAQLSDVADRLAALAAPTGDEPAGTTVLFAPWRNDGHPDHEATGHAAAGAALASGAELVEYPIWAWNLQEPGDDDAMPWARARAVVLPDAVRAAKAHALDAFVSQTERQGDGDADAAVLPPAILAHFMRAIEVLLVP